MGKLFVDTLLITHYSSGSFREPQRAGKIYPHGCFVLPTSRQTPLFPASPELKFDGPRVDLLSKQATLLLLQLPLPLQCPRSRCTAARHYVTL
jgi:hypothetical protein